MSISTLLFPINKIKIHTSYIRASEKTFQSGIEKVGELNGFDPYDQLQPPFSVREIIRFTLILSLLVSIFIVSWLLFFQYYNIVFFRTVCGVGHSLFCQTEELFMKRKWRFNDCDNLPSRKRRKIDYGDTQFQCHEPPRNIQPPLNPVIEYKYWLEVDIDRVRVKIKGEGSDDDYFSGDVIIEDECSKDEIHAKIYHLCFDNFKLPLYDISRWFNEDEKLLERRKKYGKRKELRDFFFRGYHWSEDDETKPKENSDYFSLKYSDIGFKGYKSSVYSYFVTQPLMVRIIPKIYEFFQVKFEKDEEAAKRRSSGRPMRDFVINEEVLRKEKKLGSNEKKKMRSRMDYIMNQLKMPFGKALKDTKMNDCSFIRLVLYNDLLGESYTLLGSNSEHLIVTENDRYVYNIDKEKKGPLHYYFLKLSLKITNDDYPILVKNEAWPDLNVIYEKINAELNSFREYIYILMDGEKQVGLKFDIIELEKRAIERNPYQYIEIIKSTQREITDSLSNLGGDSFASWKQDRKVEFIRDGNRLIVSTIWGWSHDGALTWQYYRKFIGDEDKRQFELGLSTHIDSNPYVMRNFKPDFLWFQNLDDNKKLQRVLGIGAWKLVKSLKDYENTTFCYELNLPHKLELNSLDNSNDSLTVENRDNRVDINFDKKAGIMHYIGEEDIKIAKELGIEFIEKRRDKLACYRFNILKSEKRKIALKKEFVHNVDDGLTVDSILDFEDLFLSSLNLDLLFDNPNRTSLKLPFGIIKDDYGLLGYFDRWRRVTFDYHLHVIIAIMRSRCKMIEWEMRNWIRIGYCKTEVMKAFYRYFVVNQVYKYENCFVVDPNCSIREISDLDKLKLRLGKNRDTVDGGKSVVLFSEEFMKGLYNLADEYVVELEDDSELEKAKIVVNKFKQINDYTLSDFEQMCVNLKTVGRMSKENKSSNNTSMDFWYEMSVFFVIVGIALSDYACSMICGFAYDSYFKEDYSKNGNSEREVANKSTRRIVNRNSSRMRNFGVRKLECSPYMSDGESQILINNITNTALQVLLGILAITCDVLFQEISIQKVTVKRPENDDNIRGHNYERFEQFDFEKIDVKCDKVKYPRQWKLYEMLRDAFQSNSELLESRGVSYYTLNNPHDVIINSILEPSQIEATDKIIEKYKNSVDLEDSAKNHTTNCFVQNWPTGKGKSLSSIQVASILSKSSRKFSIIICPKTLIENWTEKFVKWDYLFKSKRLVEEYSSGKKWMGKMRNVIHSRVILFSIEKFLLLCNRLVAKEKNDSKLEDENAEEEGEEDDDHLNLSDKQLKELDFFFWILKVSGMFVFDEFQYISNNNGRSNVLKNFFNFLNKKFTKMRRVNVFLSATIFRNDSSYVNLLDLLSQKEEMSDTKNEIISHLKNFYYGGGEFVHLKSAMKKLKKFDFDYDEFISTKSKNLPIKLFNEVCYLKSNETEKSQLKEYVPKGNTPSAFNRYAISTTLLCSNLRVMKEYLSLKKDFLRAKILKSDVKVEEKLYREQESDSFGKIVVFMKERFQSSDKTNKLIAIENILKSISCENGFKVALFSDYVQHLDFITDYAVANDLTNREFLFRMTGRNYDDESTDSKERNLDLASFQNAPCGINLTSKMIGVTGYDMIFVNFLVNLEADWDYTKMVQGIGRSFRKNQLKDVHFITLISGELEQSIFKVSLLKHFAGLIVQFGKAKTEDEKDLFKGDCEFLNTFRRSKNKGVQKSLPYSSIIQKIQKNYEKSKRTEVIKNYEIRPEN